MRSPISFAALAGMLLILSSWGDVAAQEDETAYVYSSYWECGGGLGQAVATLRDDWGPIIQKHVDAGHVTAWGVLTHDTGNKWSLANYHVGPDIGALKRALDETQAEYFEAHAERGREFSRSCPTHEDYIWTTGPGSVQGAAIAQTRPAAAISVYWVCHEGREAVADLIVEKVWAPIFDRQVQEGRLNSWAWLSHFIGGKFRRLLVTDGADHAALLEARDEMIREIGQNPGLASAFSDVCDGHTDVMWNVTVSKP